MSTQRLHECLARNVKVIRQSANLTLDAVATACRAYGVSWGTGILHDIEAGKRAPTLQNLLILAAGLTDVTGHVVTARDLLGGDAEIAVTDSVAVTATHLRDFMAGGPAILRKTTPELLGEADYRAAKNIGVDPTTALDAMDRLWGRSLSQECNRRGSGQNPQKRGRITRELMTQLAKELA